MHGGLKEGKKIQDYFGILIIKSYKKPLDKKFRGGEIYN